MEIEKPNEATGDQEMSEHNSHQVSETPDGVNHAHRFIYAYIILIVLAALAGLGTYWYHHYHYKPKLSTSLNATNNLTKVATSPATSFFTVKEWGVRAPYSGNLHLQYAVSGPDSLSLSSSQLAAGGPAVCTSTDNGEAGILSRYLPSDSNLGPKIPASETAQEYIEQNPSVPHAKIGSYIYIYWGNSYLTNGSYDGPCSDKAAAQQTISAYSTLVSKLQVIPANVSTSNDPYAGWKTYTSTSGGFSLKYPSSWGLSGFQGYNPVSSGQMDGSEDEVRIVSNPAQNQTSRVNNFGVQINIQDSPGTSTPYNTYGNGSTAQLPNNITLWQEKEQVNYATGPSTDTCPSMEIGMDNSYSMKLSNGKYLQVYGSFCWAQGQTTTYSYTQQVASTEWVDAIDIIKSMTFN